MTVAVQEPGVVTLITKGAFHQVLEICVRTADGAPLSPDVRLEIERCHDDWPRQGIRALAVATRTLNDTQACSREDERDMTFMGFLAFLDRPWKVLQRPLPRSLRSACRSSSSPATVRS